MEIVERMIVEKVLRKILDAIFFKYNKYLLSYSKNMILQAILDNVDVKDLKQSLLEIKEIIEKNLGG
jgi:hypothetical protein